MSNISGLKIISNLNPGNTHKISSLKIKCFGKTGKTPGLIKISALLAILLATAAGCGGNPPQKKVVLNMWGTFETTANIQPFINAFKKTYPTVTINYTEKDVNTYEQDLINALATGTGPDIYALHNDWLPKYKDKLIPASDKILTIKDINDNFVDTVKHDFVSADNKIYALPLSVDSLALYYNKDILGTFNIAVPPRTWADLAKDSRIITQQDTTGYFSRSGVAMGTTANINRAVDILYLLMLQNHTLPSSADFSNSTLDQAVQDNSGKAFYPAADALNFYTSFANPNSGNYNWNLKSNYSIDAFANGQLAFLYGYSFTRDAITLKSPNLNFDVVPVPEPNLLQNTVNFANYWGFGVSRQTKYPDTSWNFLKSMVSKSQLESYYIRHKLPSSRKDIISEQIIDPVIGVFAAANLTAKPFYKKDQQAVDQIILNMIDDVTIRNKGITEALATANALINRLNY